MKTKKGVTDYSERFDGKTTEINIGSFLGKDDAKRYAKFLVGTKLNLTTEFVPSDFGTMTLVAKTSEKVTTGELKNTILEIIKKNKLS